MRSGGYILQPISPDDSGIYPSTTALPDTSHRDLWGILTLDEVCRSLEEAEPLPHILVFKTLETWRFWSKKYTGSPSSRLRIWACIGRRGIDMDMINEMLEFGGIGGGGAKYRLHRRRDHAQGWAVITSDDAPNYYLAIFCYGGDVGFSMFEVVARQLGIEEGPKDENPQQALIAQFITQMEEGS